MAFPVQQYTGSSPDHGTGTCRYSCWPMHKTLSSCFFQIHIHDNCSPCRICMCSQKKGLTFSGPPYVPKVWQHISKLLHIAVLLFWLWQATIHKCSWWGAVFGVAGILLWHDILLWQSLTAEGLLRDSVLQARPYARADFSHSNNRLMKIAYDNQKLVQRLTNISRKVIEPSWPLPSCPGYIVMTFRTVHYSRNQFLHALSIAWLNCHTSVSCFLVLQEPSWSQELTKTSPSNVASSAVNRRKAATAIAQVICVLRAFAAYMVLKATCQCSSRRHMVCPWVDTESSTHYACQQVLLDAKL